MKKIILITLLSVGASSANAGGRGVDRVDPFSFCEAAHGVSSTLKKEVSFSLSVGEAMKQISIDLDDVTTPKEKAFLIATGKDPVAFLKKRNFLSVSLGACNDGSKKALTIRSTKDIFMDSGSASNRNVEMIQTQMENGDLIISASSLNLEIIIEYSKISAVELAKTETVPTLVKSRSKVLRMQGASLRGMLN